jgi:serine/threonine protein kinase
MHRIPSTILFKREHDHVRTIITDFGLAQLEQESNLTLTGDILGTLRYMSPEQALGVRGLVDRRTHSLALVLVHRLVDVEYCSMRQVVK